MFNPRIMEALAYTIPQDIQVLYIQAENFPQGIPGAFEKLNQIPGGLKDRHVYGITACIGDQLVYRACVKENFKGEGEQYGLSSYAIPKGKYLYTVLENWPENLARIPGLFDELMALPNVKKQTVCLEDYTADGNMLAMVQQA